MDITIHIPENCEPYAADIKRFVDAMVYKLRKNAHKGRWEDLGTAEAYQLMCGEAEELRTEIERETPNAYDVTFECADVANFALMISSMVTEKARSGFATSRMDRTNLWNEAYKVLTPSELRDMAERKETENGEIPF